jgi:hypothetical protein
MNQPDKPLCFVMMSFKEKYDSLYEDVVCLAAEEAGLYPIRSDKIHRPGDILEEICEVMTKSPVCVAEISDLNPNVMYELGWAHGFGKKEQVVILMREGQKRIQVPFDFEHARMIRYSIAKADWKSTLQQELVVTFKQTLRADSFTPCDLLGDWCYTCTRTDTGHQHGGVCKICMTSSHLALSGTREWFKTGESEEKRTPIRWKSEWATITHDNYFRFGYTVFGEDFEIEGEIRKGNAKGYAWGEVELDRGYPVTIRGEFFELDPTYHMYGELELTRSHVMNNTA